MKHRSYFSKALAPFRSLGCSRIVFNRQLFLREPSDDFCFFYHMMAQSDFIIQRSAVDVRCSKPFNYLFGR